MAQALTCRMPLHRCCVSGLMAALANTYSQRVCTLAVQAGSSGSHWFGCWKQITGRAFYKDASVEASCIRLCLQLPWVLFLREVIGVLLAEPRVDT